MMCILDYSAALPFFVWCSHTHTLTHSGSPPHRFLYARVNTWLRIVISFATDSLPYWLHYCAFLYLTAHAMTRNMYDSVPHVYKGPLNVLKTSDLVSSCKTPDNKPLRTKTPSSLPTFLGSKQDFRVSSHSISQYLFKASRYTLCRVCA